MYRKAEIMKKTKSLIRNLFILYLIFLVIFVIVKFNGDIYELLARITDISNRKMAGELTLNFVPFSNRGMFSNWKLSIINIILFIPLGFFIKMLTQYNFYQVISICFLLILFIELLQFIFCLGYADIDDVILNSIGAIIGYFISNMINKSYFHIEK